MQKVNGEIEDERRALPSASSWRRYELCGASFQLEQRARELGQVAHEGGAAATRGEMIHKWLAGEKVSLSLADLADAQFLKDRADEEVRRIFGDIQLEEYVEKRLWLKQGNRRLFSGRFDRVVIAGKVALVQDYKSGRSPVDDAELNGQLKALAVLVAVNDPLLDEVIVQLVTRNQRVTGAKYTIRDLEKAYDEMQAVLTRLFDPSSQPTPHPDACRWCPAELVCPALKKLSRETQPAPERLPGGGKEAAAILDSIAILRNLYDSVEEYYTKVVKEFPDAIPGWQLVPGRKQRDVTDWPKATAILAGCVPIEKIQNIASWKLTEIEALIGQELGLKPKEATAKFNELLNGLIEWKSNAPSLKRIKEQT